MPDSPETHEVDDAARERIEFLETLLEVQQAQKSALEQDVARLTMLVRSQQRVIAATTNAPEPH